MFGQIFVTFKEVQAFGKYLLREGVFNQSE